MSWKKIQSAAVIPYPCWMANANTGQAHWWGSFSDMERCEPLYHLYTHWMEDNRPIPPPKPDPIRDACVEWYAGLSGKNGHPSTEQCFRAGWGACQKAQKPI